MSLRVAICISTHNRRDDLDRTLSVVRKLDPAPDEVIVAADGCTDDTVAFVRENYPSYRLTVNQTARGSVATRDAMMRGSTSDILLSLDDDSHPIETDAVDRLRAMFSDNPRLAVASFPQRTDEFPATLTATDFGPAHFAANYVNCACAFRREVFVALGGHCVAFWHAYDESDFTVRCLSAGWQVRFEPAITIRHHYSGVNRNEIRIHHLHARNELWSALMRCPMPQLLAVAPFRVWRQFLYACKRGWSWVWREPRWWWQCLAGLARCLSSRRALAWPRYRAWMQLARKPIESAAAWEAKFGPR